MKSTSVIKNIKGKILGYFAKTKGDDYSTFFKTVISNDFIVLSGSNNNSSAIFSGYEYKYSFIYISPYNNNVKHTITLMDDGSKVIIQGLVIITYGDLIIKNVNGSETFSFVDNITPDFVVGHNKLYLIKEPLIFTR